MRKHFLSVREKNKKTWLLSFLSIKDTKWQWGQSGQIPTKRVTGKGTSPPCWTCPCPSLPNAQPAGLRKSGRRQGHGKGGESGTRKRTPRCPREHAVPSGWRILSSSPSFQCWRDVISTQCIKRTRTGWRHCRRGVWRHRWPWECKL